MTASHGGWRFGDQSYMLDEQVGPDLDGFIEPTIPEIGRVEDLSKLVRPSADYYGPDVADAILYRARVVRQALAMRQA